MGLIKIDAFSSRLFQRKATASRQEIFEYLDPDKNLIILINSNNTSGFFKIKIDLIMAECAPNMLFTIFGFYSLEKGDVLRVIFDISES